MLWAYIVIVVCVCLSAYFSGTEITFNSVNKMRLRRAAENGNEDARSILEQLEQAASALQ